MPNDWFGQQRPQGPRGAQSRRDPRTGKVERVYSAREQAERALAAQDEAYRAFYAAYQSVNALASNEEKDNLLADIADTRARMERSGYAHAERAADKLDAIKTTLSEISAVYTGSTDGIPSETPPKELLPRDKAERITALARSLNQSSTVEIKAAADLFREGMNAIKASYGPGQRFPEPDSSLYNRLRVWNSRLYELAGNIAHLASANRGPHGSPGGSRPGGYR